MSAISLAGNEPGSSVGVGSVVVLGRVVVERSGVFEVDAVGIVGPAFLSSDLTRKKMPIAARVSTRTPTSAPIAINGPLLPAFGFWPGGVPPSGGGGGHEEPPGGPGGGAGGAVNPYCWDGGGVAANDAGVAPNGGGGGGGDAAMVAAEPIAIPGIVAAAPRCRMVSA